MILCRVIQQITQSVARKNESAVLHLLIISPALIFYFISGLYFGNHLKHFNVTMKDDTTGQRGSIFLTIQNNLMTLIRSVCQFHAGMTTQLCLTFPGFMQLLEKPGFRGISTFLVVIVRFALFC